MFGDRRARQANASGSLKLDNVPVQYDQELSQLTFNCKPLITSLSIMADENINKADEIVNVIETRIKKNPKDKKLPVIYLMDSILKNVGGVYIELFCKNIFSTFIDAYQSVDDKVKGSLIRLLGTWKDCSLFPKAVLDDIEKRIKSIAEENIKKQNVKKEWVQGNKGHTVPNPMPYVDPSRTFNGYQEQIPAPGTIPMQPINPIGNPLSFQDSTNANVLQQRLFLNQPIQQPFNVNPTQYFNYPYPQNPLFNPMFNPYMTQLPYGNVPYSGTMPDINKQSTLFNTNKSRQPDFNDPSSMRELNTKAISSLYEDIPLQCNQCAMRFFVQSDLDKHYDWHYEINKKQKEKKTKKPLSRAWFLSLEDWLDTKGGIESSTIVKYNPFENKEEQEEVKEESNLIKMLRIFEINDYVKIKVDESQDDKCFGCGEVFEQKYDSEQDEWYFKEAIRGDDNQIYHLKCYNLPQGKRVKRKIDEISDGTEIM